MKLYKGTVPSIVNPFSMDIESTTEKVLGMFWDTKLKSTYLNCFGVQIMMSVFDPLGLIALYIVRAEMYLQELWMRKVNDWSDDR